MAYSIIAQNNSTTTLADENGNVITVPSRSILDAGTTFTLVKINNNTATLEDSNGKIYRDIPCCIDLTQVTGFNVTKVNNDKATLEDGDGKVYAGVPCVVNLTGTGGGSAVIEELNVTPSTSAQTITASGGVDGYSPVNVAAVDASIDANIVAGNIKNGVEILGVTGNVVELNGETKTVTPQVYGQTLYPTSPKNAITEITVNAVTSSIDANITAGNIKKDVTILGVTGTFEGGAAGKYQLLQRVKDDTNTEIGTVCGFHKDANNNEYAVVALDAEFRNASGNYLSEGALVSDLAAVYDQTLWESDIYTATSNCDKILAFANANGYTSTAVSHCRSKSFVIESVTYYGQLPTIFELLDVFKNRTALNTKDTTAGSYPSLIVPNNTDTWSSSQTATAGGWYLSKNGTVAQKNKTLSVFVLPVLELPNN